MTQPIRVNDPVFLELLVEQPRLADLLVSCMAVQGDVDPEAGFGAMQPFALWNLLGLPSEVIPAFLKEANNPYKAYVILRCTRFLFGYKDVLPEALAQGKPIPYKELVDAISAVCNSFRVDFVTPHLNEETKCQSASRSVAKSKLKGSRKGCSPTPSKRKRNISKT